MILHFIPKNNYDVTTFGDEVIYELRKDNKIYIKKEFEWEITEWKDRKTLLMFLNDRGYKLINEESNIEVQTLDLFQYNFKDGI